MSKIGSIPGFTSDESGVDNISDNHKEEIEEKQQADEEGKNNEEEKEEEGKEENKDKDDEIEEQKKTVEDQEFEESLLEKVKIGEDEYNAEQLTNLIKKAKNYDELLPEFTRKSQKLATFEKTISKKEIDSRPESKVIVDNEVQVDSETEKVLEAWAKKKGLAPLSELKKIQYEEEKQRQIDLFIEKHPEYNMDNDPDNVRWGKIISALENSDSFYRLPTDAKKVGNLLDRIHNDLSGTNRNESATKILAKMKKAESVSAGSFGGASKKDNSKSGIQLTESQREMLRRGGWTDEAIKEYYGGI